MVWRNLIRKKLNKWVQHKLYIAAAAWAFSDRRQGGPKGSLAQSPVPGSSKSFTFFLLVYPSASYTAQASEPCSPVTESGQATVQGRFLQGHGANKQPRHVWVMSTTKRMKISESGCWFTRWQNPSEIVSMTSGKYQINPL